jgi:SHS2 domain-containing protein
MERYRIFEHTADAGIEAFGRDEAELFANAALGMYALMCEPSRVRPIEERSLAVSGSNRETLLIAWLLELLFLTETEGLVFSDFEVSIAADEASLQGQVRGEAYDPERHDGGAVVKAVTRHQLQLERVEAGWRARIIFDI